MASRSLRSSGTRAAEIVPSFSTKVFTCTSCRREFSSAFGLRYHLENFVCRPELRPPGMPPVKDYEEGMKNDNPQEEEEDDDDDDDDDSVIIDVVNVDRNDDDPSDDKDTTKSKPKKTSSATKRKDNTTKTKRDRTKNKSEITKQKGDSAKKKTPAKKRKKAAPTPEELTCPHCTAVLCNHYGFQYHIKNFVCRPDLRPGGPPATGRRRELNDAIPAENGKNDKTVSDTAVDLDSDTGKRRKPSLSNELPPNTCSHCFKTFHSAHTLQYHLDREVCQPKRKRGLGDNDDEERERAARNGKRFRGNLEDRTCSECGMVFTSIHGKQYHQKQRVCEKKKLRGAKPFPTLEAGSQYVTPFGVVEVVADNRAVPTAFTPTDLAKQMRKWTADCRRHLNQKSDRVDRAAVASMVRRMQFRNAYERRRPIDAIATRYVYDQQSKLSKSTSKIKLMNILRPRPTEPEHSFPGRPVECRWIPDERKRDDQDKPARRDKLSMTLFLRRDALTVPYDKESYFMVCSDCGKHFESMEGWKQHQRHGVCVGDKSHAVFQRLKQLQTKAENEIERIRRGPVAHLTTQKRALSHKQYKKMEKPYYPQVLLSLGFKLLPREQQRIRLSVFPRRSAEYYEKRAQEEDLYEDQAVVNKDEEEAYKPSGQKNKPVKKKKVVALTRAKVRLTAKDQVHPDEIIRQVEREQEELNNLLMGGMYPAVFHALGYERRTVSKPGTVIIYREVDKLPDKQTRKAKAKLVKKAIKTVKETKKKKKKQRKRRTTGRKSRQSEAVPPPIPPAVLAPYVDVRVIVEELDSGRYPSIYRLGKGDNHHSFCHICKGQSTQQHSLYECAFCPQSFHWNCARTRYTMKDPEPGDDMLCAKCIATVKCRRTRAHKRRIEKMLDPKELPLAEEENNESQEHQLASNLIEGREFECLAAQARRIDDLKELLADARLRLAQSVILQRVERVQRGLFLEYEDAILGPPDLQVIE